MMEPSSLQDTHLVTSHKRATQMNNTLKSITVTPTFCEAGVSDSINLNENLEDTKGEITGWAARIREIFGRRQSERER